MSSFIIPIHEAAKVAQTDRETIERACKAGLLPSKKMGNVTFIPRIDLMAWIKRGKPMSKGDVQQNASGKKSKKKANSNQQPNSEQAPWYGTDKDTNMRQVYDPALYDHQIPNYSKYQNHSEDSYNSHYDIYEDGDTDRYD